MKKLIITVTLLSILYSLNLNAQSKYGIEIGGNYFSFQNEKTHSNLGFTIGISREWELNKNKALVGELLFSTKGGMLKNKRILSYSQINEGDILCTIGFIEIPFLYRYYIPFFKNSRMQFSIGPSLSIAILDNIETKNVRIVYSYDYPEEYEQKTPQYDYISDQDPGPLWVDTWNNSGFGLNIGIGINWDKFSISCRYYKPFHKINAPDSLMIHERFYNFSLLLNILLSH